MKIYIFSHNSDLYAHDSEWSIYKTLLDPTHDAVLFHTTRLKAHLGPAASQIRIDMVDTVTGEFSNVLRGEIPVKVRIEVNPAAAALKKPKNKPNADEIFLWATQTNPEVQF